ncbi:MAG: 50S ribosomal protein L37ae [Candidatus Hydrothermarchaeales archaeon]
MAKRTKKVGPAGKFRTNYGMSLRKKYAGVDRKMRIPHKCPNCEKMAVKRKAAGIWECRKCGAKFSGGAYLPKTSIATTTDHILSKVTERS